MGIYFYIAAAVAIVSFIGIIILIICLINMNKQTDEGTSKVENADYISRQYGANQYNTGGYNNPSSNRTVEYQPTCDVSVAVISFTDENGIKTIKDIGSVMNIGRNGDNDFVIEDTRTSGIHCRIFNENADFYIEDASSRNGTFVNGVRIMQRTEIHDGDVVMFGKAKYTINF